MLDINRSRLEELSAATDGTMAMDGDRIYVKMDDNWHPISAAEVKELSWNMLHDKPYWQTASTPIGLYTIELDADYEDYELVLVARDPFSNIIFRGTDSSDEGLLNDVTPAMTICQGHFDNLILSCLEQ